MNEREKEKERKSVDSRASVHFVYSSSSSSIPVQKTSHDSRL